MCSVTACFLQSDASEKPAARANTATAGFLVSAMRDLFVWNAFDRAFLHADGRARERLDHFAGPLGIGDPFVVELVRTRRDTAISVAGVDHAGVAAVDQLEEMVLRLAGTAGGGGARLRKQGV